MKRFLLATITVAVLIAPAADMAAAHNNHYAFPAREVRIKQNNLRYVFNSLPAFEDWGPHVVRCRGLNATTMSNGSRGYKHIRCQVETLNIPDFIYHVNASGKVVTTRAWG